jgi:L-seryl-tRNA(Ser) seleniumtransferase
VPVIVDAAAQVPPVASLWRFTAEIGADAVIFSGGKGLRGPQASGLVLGKRWIVDRCRAHASPYQQIGRGMKVGKEELLALLAAVEWTLEQDEDAMLAGYERMVDRWIAGLQGLPGVVVERGYPSEAGQPHSRAIVRLSTTSAWTRDELVAALWDRDPRIAVGTFRLPDDAIALNPQTIEPGEDAVVLDALVSLLSSGHGEQAG